jgi:hypothetical protein
MKKISFVTLGCKTNQFESAAMTEAPRKLPCRFRGEAADICVINTCTVTARTDAESDASSGGHSGKTLPHESSSPAAMPRSLMKSAPCPA